MPRTEEPRWTTSRLQRLPHNKSAGKQVHHLRFLDPERKAPKGARTRDTSRAARRAAAARRQTGREDTVPTMRVHARSPVEVDRRKAPHTVWPTFTDCFCSWHQRQAFLQCTARMNQCSSCALCSSLRPGYQLLKQHSHQDSYQGEDTNQEPCPLLVAEGPGRATGCSSGRLASRLGGGRRGGT